MNRWNDIVGRCMAWFARVVAGTSDRWVNCEPSTRQRIYFANHSSHLDIILLWASLPREVRALTRPIAARDYWDRPGLRRYLAEQVFNVIMIDRSGHGGGIRDPLKGIEAAIEGMGDRYSLIIFPEGTRSQSDTMGEFKSGIYHIAKRKPGVELVPVYMENLNRILPKGEVIPVPLISSVSFGAPLILQPDEPKHAFLERAEKAVLALGE